MEESSSSAQSEDQLTNLKRIWKSGTSNRTRSPWASSSSGVGSGVASGMKRASQPNENDMTILIAKELNQLSMQERATVYEQLHGVADETLDTESPESLCALSEKMLEEAKRIRDRSAFDKAMFLGPSYVTDVDFLSMFLRAENYDAKLAARRVVRHFQFKLELFGEERLARPILYADLDEDDRHAFHLGRVQILAERRDRAGRLVIYTSEGLNAFKAPINMNRVAWYLFMRHIVLDVEAQKKGVVFLRYCVHAHIYDPNDKGLKSAIGNSAGLPSTLPIKINAFHFCYHDSKMIPAMSLMQMVIGMAWRVRFRAHYGSFVECMYSLMTFGIPRQVVPVNPDDGLPLVEEFLSSHEAQVQGESENVSGTDHLGRILFPRANDVLLGRGRPYQEFFGNRMMATMIADMKEEYQASGKNRKTEVTNIVLQRVKQSGGRFLKKTDDTKFWVPATDDVARDKVSHGFRTKTKSQAEKVTSSIFDLPIVGEQSSDSSDLDTSDGGSSAKRARFSLSVFGY